MQQLSARSRQQQTLRRSQRERAARCRSALYIACEHEMQSCSVLTGARDVHCTPRGGGLRCIQAARRPPPGGRRVPRLGVQLQQHPRELSGPPQPAPAVLDGGERACLCQNRV